MIEIDKTEKVLRIVRKHWFVLLADIVLLVLFVAIPVIFFVAWNALNLSAFISYDGSPIFAAGFFLFAWLLLIWIVGWHMWTDYYLDVFIITDKRIFDITQYGLFRRTSSSFRLDRIQNITVEMSGIIQTLLDFGTIRLETAGEREDFVANYLARPYELKKTINEMQDIEAEKSQLVHLVGDNSVQAGTSGIMRDPSSPPPSMPGEGLPRSRHKIF